jgi:hypothetical protein
MRSFAEVAFRARQEAANLWLLVAPPKFSGQGPSPSLPDPTEALRGSAYATRVEQVARQVLNHKFPLLGVTIETGPEVRWRRDYAHGVESDLRYFRRIPYLDFRAVGDHKFIWELNRHQHLVLLAQAFRLTGNRAFIAEIISELESWLEQNPFQRGINWASALEVAFRAISWIWVHHLIVTELPGDFRRRFLTGLYRHRRHLEENLSIYFSPNTHLLGEAVALHALGGRRAASIVRSQLDFQVKPDGSHFEQSTYYHVYALDFFLFHYILAGRPNAFRPTLERMAEYLHWLLGQSRQIAFFGDDDGGRLFHPYGNRSQFGRATLATCGILFDREEWIGTADDIAEQAAWWLGAETLQKARRERSAPLGTRLFADSGMAFLESGDLEVQMDCGPFGYGGAGHSHADTLSVVVSLKGERVLADPGTYTYISDPKERNWFRGSAAHNTVRIDGLDQGDPAGPFRWASKPEVVLKTWRPHASGGYVDAICRYHGFTHRRQVLLNPDLLLVVDDIDGPEGEHTCEQIWQLGQAASRARILFSTPASSLPSKFSPAYGACEPAESLVAKMTGKLPGRIAMLLDSNRNGSLTIERACELLEQASFAV